MILTPENYYSPEANFEYMSVSQFKDFSGTYGQVGCEARSHGETPWRIPGGKDNRSAGRELCGQLF